MSQIQRESISLDLSNDPYSWKCICGNHPSKDGFYPCDAQGNRVEPIEKDWTTGLYICATCGRMISPETLEVVGYASFFG